MEQFEGSVTELGDAVTEATRTGTLATYSYVTVGGTMLKKLKIFTGISGKLTMALQSGERVTLYRKHDFLIGIKFANGQTFGSDLPTANFTMLFYIVAGFPFTLFLIGFVLWWMAWKLWLLASAKSAAESIPNVVMI